MHGWLVLANRGNTLVPGGAAAPGESYTLELVLTSDGVLPEGPAEEAAGYREDMLAPGGRLTHTPTLGPGGEDVLEFNIETPAGMPEETYLCARIDPGNRIMESNEQNNHGCARLKPPLAEPRKGRE